VDRHRHRQRRLRWSVSLMTVVRSLFDMPAVTFSVRFNRGHLTCLPVRQEHLHLDSVSIQLSVFIYIISVNLHAFLLAVVPECVLLTFACYYILIRFSIC